MNGPLCVPKSVPVRNTAETRYRYGVAGGLRGILRLLRYYLGPLSLLFYRRRYCQIVAELQPGLVHALRIPFEGMLATNTPVGIPLVISTWGNDLTLHARGSFLMAHLTRRVLHRADGLITDTQRDVGLGTDWGFAVTKSTLVAPGSGGIRVNEILAISAAEKLPEELPTEPIIVNPAGYFLSGHPTSAGKNSQCGLRLPFPGWGWRRRILGLQVGYPEQYKIMAALKPGTIMVIIPEVSDFCFSKRS